MTQNKNETFVTLRGLWFYPKRENGVLKVAIGINQANYLKLVERIKNETGYDYQKEQNEKLGYYLINAHTMYELHAFDSNDETIANVTHGSQVLVRLHFKEYEHMGKKGLTCYLSDVLVEKLEKTNQVNAETMLRDVL